MENQEAFMLETQHVSKHYGKLEVLKDINLSLIHISEPTRP